jgi:hypothetical protein
MHIRTLLTAACAACLLTAPLEAGLVLDGLPSDKADETVDAIPKPVEPAPKAGPKFAEDCFPDNTPAGADARLASIPAAPAYQPLMQNGGRQNGTDWARPGWRPVTQADPELRSAARNVALVQLCYVTGDGLPREVDFGGAARSIESAYYTFCTGILLPGNRLLLPHYCMVPQGFTEAGFTVGGVQAVFGYIDRQTPPLTVRAAAEPLAMDKDLGAAVLSLEGTATGALGDGIAGTPSTDLPQYHPLVMLHHPMGQPMRVSAADCLELSHREDLAKGQFRHSCETAGGSGGGLLLDARTLAPRGMHYSSINGDSRRALDLRTIDAALDLGLTAE